MDPSQFSIHNETTVLGVEVVMFLKEFWQFLRVRKKFWLLPVLLVAFLLGALIVLSQGSTAAPFIYTIF